MKQRRQRGVTLVELMIAMVLGLVVLGAVMGVFLANRQTYRTSEGLGRMQENARYAFEVLGRSLREAGGNPCGQTQRVANVLNGGSSWWANWGNAIRGYEGSVTSHIDAFPHSRGSSTAQRVDDAGNTTSPDAFIVLSGSLQNGLIITEHNPMSAQFKVNTTQHGLQDGDILMACDGRQAAIFQVSSANSTNNTIVHNTGGSISPGNCSKGLGFPTVCTATGTSYTFAQGGMLTKLSAEAWYIGNNPRGGRSLYRLTLSNSSGTASANTPKEVVPNVRNLQLTYLTRTGTALANNYAAANQVDWTEVAAGNVAVTAVRIELETEDATVPTNNQPLVRRWASVVQLRNMAWSQ